MKALVFDWDDTLLPSSYIHQQQHTKIDTLKDIEELIYQTLYVTLNTKCNVGVYIITNAAQGWVQYSAARYMPKLLPLLRQCNVISARHLYSTKYINSPQRWKCLAMEEHIPDFVSQIISIGDSKYEREAARAMCKNRWGCVSKSIKMVEKPSLQNLLEQLQVLVGQWDYIIDYEQGFDLMLQFT